MMFSTSSPTYPASVSVVASAMVNGTLRSRASVLGEQGLPATGGADEQHVALRQLHLVDLDPRVEPLVVVVHRDREHPLRVKLAHDVVVEDAVYLARGWAAGSRSPSRTSPGSPRE